MFLLRIFLFYLSIIVQKWKHALYETHGWAAPVWISHKKAYKLKIPIWNIGFQQCDIQTLLSYFNII